MTEKDTVPREEGGLVVGEAVRVAAARVAGSVAGGLGFFYT
jgi:hypothetical protein